MADKRITDVDFVDLLNSNESFFINQNNSIKQINKNNIVFGVANGGTGATTAKEARANLGVSESAFIITENIIPTVVEITKAYQDGRFIVFYDSNVGKIMNLNELTSDKVVFENIDNNGILYRKILTNSGWQNESIQLALPPVKKTDEGSINVALENNCEYLYANVTNLTMTSANVECHGFIVFADNPIVEIKYFLGSAGDDITEVASGEIWEFSVYPSPLVSEKNDQGYIIWKNWSAD